MNPASSYSMVEAYGVPNALKVQGTTSYETGGYDPPLSEDLTSAVGIVTGIGDVVGVIEDGQIVFYDMAAGAEVPSGSDQSGVSVLIACD